MIGTTQTNETRDASAGPLWLPRFVSTSGVQRVLPSQSRRSPATEFDYDYASDVTSPQVLSCLGVFHYRFESPALIRLDLLYSWLALAGWALGFGPGLTGLAGPMAS